jgi:hypothetical protein
MRKQATLKELCYEYSEDDLDLEPIEWHAADCLVKIFDVYASEFAEWSVARAMGLDSFKLNDGELEQFKKEKEL